MSSLPCPKTSNMLVVVCCCSGKPSSTLCQETSVNHLCLGCTRALLRFVSKMRKNVKQDGWSHVLSFALCACYRPLGNWLVSLPPERNAQPASWSARGRRSLAGRCFSLFLSAGLWSGIAPSPSLFFLSAATLRPLARPTTHCVRKTKLAPCFNLQAPTLHARHSQPASRPHCQAPISLSFVRAVGRRMLPLPALKRPRMLRGGQ